MRVIGPPILIETAAHAAVGMNGEVEVRHQVHFLVVYENSSMGVLECACPRTATTKRLHVWHRADCPELDRA
jgi:hypothetical protein